MSSASTSSMSSSSSSCSSRHGSVSIMSNKSVVAHFLENMFQIFDEYLQKDYGLVVGLIMNEVSTSPVREDYEDEIYKKELNDDNYNQCLAWKDRIRKSRHQKVQEIHRSSFEAPFGFSKNLCSCTDKNICTGLTDQPRWLYAAAKLLTYLEEDRMELIEGDRYPFIHYMVVTKAFYKRPNYYEFWHAMKHTKKYIIRASIKRLAIHHIDGLDRKLVKHMIECMFEDMDIVIYFHHKPRKYYFKK